MPLGNYTSQFFANVYLNEFDYFVKHTLKAKHYIRYVDDFVILHASKTQLKTWKMQINEFLENNLKLKLHPQKSRIFPLSQGIDFVGFRVFFHNKLLRKRNIHRMQKKIFNFEQGLCSYRDIMQSYTGWQGYAKQAHTFKLRRRLLVNIAKIKYKKLKRTEIS